MFSNDIGEIGEELVSFAEFSEICDSGQGHIDVGIDQFFAAGNLGQIQSSFDDSVNTADVSNHGCGIEFAGFHHGDGFFHVIGVAAGSTDNVGAAVVDIVEVEFSFEFGVGRTCKEVQAAVGLSALSFSATLQKDAAPIPNARRLL